MVNLASIAFEACGRFLEFNKHQTSGRSAVYALVGDPVDHSLSPAIQNAAFHSMGIDAVYVPFRVERSTLASSIKALRVLGIKGFNVTAPHKVTVIRHLDNLEGSAAKIGSVNTVINEKGKLRGHNTDGMGALRALKEAGVSAEGKSVLIFGAGGAARAIAHTLAPRASSIQLVNRTIGKAKALAARLRRKYGVTVEIVPLSASIKDLVKEADVLVNGSSMGMDGRADVPVRAEWLHSDQCVLDVVYKPFLTKLLKLANEAGATTVTGLDMLVNQGACSFELWTKRKAPIFEMRQAMTQQTEAMKRV
jgi:shikimate dehydrogenase